MDLLCSVLENVRLQADYMRIRFAAKEIASAAKPGQFVHIRIPGLRDRILRRPFSICAFDPAEGTLTVVYKIVGEGTRALAEVRSGAECRILGPLGNGFPMPGENEVTVILAGGYGAAALLPLACRSRNKALVLIGARSANDVLLTDEYRACGSDVRVATQDGSIGTKGLVTDLLDGALSDGKGTPVLYACGPNGMLMAVGKLAEKKGLRCYLSLDQHMCCGVGACFACVVKVKDPSSPDGWRYSRSCKEGPVYDAREVWYEN